MVLNLAAVGAVPETVSGLGEVRYVTVILRLMLDRQGKLLRGEVVDLAARPCARFDRWSSMSRAVRSCLAAEEYVRRAGH